MMQMIFLSNNWGSDITNGDENHVKYIDTISAYNITKYPIGSTTSVTHRGKELLPIFLF